MVATVVAQIEQRIANATDVPVHLVDAPLECVVLGRGYNYFNGDSNGSISTPARSEMKHPKMWSRNARPLPTRLRHCGSQIKKAHGAEGGTPHPRPGRRPDSGPHPFCCTRI